MMNTRRTSLVAVAFCLVIGMSMLVSDRPQPTQTVPEYITQSGAYQALNDFNAQRAYPGKGLPRSGYFDAYRLTRGKLAEVNNKAIDTPPWQAIGPHNIGGRMLTLAFNPQNPNTIYAGSASGGLWRSYTAGLGVEAWHYVSTGFPVLGVSSIAIDQHDSNTMYIGTGEVYSHENTQGGIAERLTRGSFGMGILKTTDGGQTWAASLDWTYAQQRGIWVVRIDPSDSDVVWAGTTEGTYKSVDAGLTWTQVHTVVMVNDLAIHPTDPDTVFIACGNLESEGQGIYRTLNGGQDWERCFTPWGIPASFNGKALLSISESSPNVVMASIGNGSQVSGPGNATWLCRSGDTGATWSFASQLDYSLWQGWFAHDVAIHPNNPNLVLAAGIDIYRSQNAGANLIRESFWAAPAHSQPAVGSQEGIDPNYSHADHHDIVFHPTNRDIIYFANDGGIFRSIDGCRTFESCNGFLQTTQFYAGFSSSRIDSNLALGGLQDNGSAIYDGTDAWQKVIGGDGAWTAIGWGQDEELFGSYYYLNINVLRDGYWRSIRPPVEDGEAAFIAPFAVAWDYSTEDSVQVLYAGATRIFRSDDGGRTWPVNLTSRVLDGNPALTMVVSPTDYRKVYVATAPTTTRTGVFRTMDGGATWTDITGDLPDRYAVGMAVDPSDDQTVYITFSGFGTSHLFKSIDGGDSWLDMGDDLPDIPTQSVVVDPLIPSHVYVGNDIGVYVSQDGGESWTAYDSGLPDAVIAMDLTISPTNNKLRVSTYGNGVYERPLLPESEPIDEEPDPISMPIVLNQNQPNPFNAGTDIEFALGSAGHVDLRIYDLAGRMVRLLVSGHRDADWYTENWDGTDDNGRRLTSGVYLYRLQANGNIETRKMTMVR